jgi:hypothetical protein
VRGRRILFQDPDPRVLRLAERALAATGCEVDAVQVQIVEAPARMTAGGGARLGDPGPPVATVADPAELLRRIEGGGHALVVLNFDPPVRADPRWDVVWDHLERAPGPPVLLLTTAPSEDYLPLLAERRFVRNLIAKNGEPLEPEELIAAAGKLLSGDLFGLDKYLLWGAAPHAVEIRDSREKHDYIREVAGFVERFGLGDRTVALVEAIADELITNAIYNAPRDGAGRPRYAQVPRRQPVTLEPHEVGRLEVACDGHYLGIAQSDPFGSLTQETVVSYLNRCLVSRSPLSEATSSGAGIGLYRVFQSLSRFVVNIDPGRRTQVVALIDLGLSMKKFRGAPKSFHIFVAGGQRE